jgi:endonuclease III
MDKIEKIYELLLKSNKGYQQPFVSQVGKENYPYKVLISTLLSLRTKDKVTAEATERLFELAGKPSEMIKLSLKEIQEAIKPSNYYIGKSERIIEISQRLVDEFNEKVPSDMDTLLSFKGVGRKTANLVLTEGFNLPGLCVDTHVHRISNRLGIIKTKNPFDTEMALRDLLPLKMWKPFNELLVAHGQNTCNPVSPWCSKCLLDNICEKKEVERKR